MEEKKQWTLKKLTDLVGEETLNRLFIEHYLMLAGKEETKNLTFDQVVS